MQLVGTQADPLVNSAPKKWILHFSSVGPLLAALNAIDSMIPTAEPWAHDIGRNLVSWGVDTRLHRVLVGVTEITPTAVKDAKDAFGNLVQLRIDHPYHQFCCNRLADGQPYSGSDRVSANLSSCTAGFETYYTSGGRTYYGMLTAGHCWGIGTTVYQGYYDNNAQLHSTGKMGQVSIQTYGNYNSDAEFLNATFVGTSDADDLWYGPQPNPTGYAFVEGVGASFAGETVCFDGSFTGETCHGIVNGVDDCIQIYMGPYTCYQDEARPDNGSALAQSGDSGGPVIYPYGGGFHVFGTITAGASDNSEFIYSDAGSEMSLLGVALKHV